MISAADLEVGRPQAGIAFGVDMPLAVVGVAAIVVEVEVVFVVAVVVVVDVTVEVVATVEVIVIVEVAVEVAVNAKCQTEGVAAWNDLVR